MKPTNVRRAFTLIEVLVSTATVVLMLLMLVSVTDQTSSLWKRSRAKVEQFREARTGFETFTQRLGTATLNTYWDYDNPEVPTRYQRRSELRFTSGQSDKLIGPDGDNIRLTHCVFFHAPLGYSAIRPQAGTAPSSGLTYQGLDNLLNCWGYFVEYGSDERLRPEFINATGSPLRWRFRLMEFTLPTESLITYNLTSGGTSKTPKAYSYNLKTWFTDPLQRTGSSSNGTVAVHALAENIVALILTPRLSKAEELEISGTSSGDRSPLAPSYDYDSSPTTNAGSDTRYRDARLNPVNQLPPVMQVTMVAIDEDSALRLNLSKDSSDVFKIKDKFRDTAEYTKDLRISTAAGASHDSLEDELIKQRVNYRIFTSNVPLRAAKWSRMQTEK